MSSFRNLTPEDIRFRFFRTVRELPASDYAALHADRLRPGNGVHRHAAEDNTGSTRHSASCVPVHDPDNATAEFAIVVRSDLKGLGLGSILMDKIIRYSRDRGTGELCGEVLDENRGMQALARKLGFVIAPGSENGTRSLSLKLS